MSLGSFFFCKNPNFLTKPRYGNRLTAVEACMWMCEKYLLASPILTHPLTIPSDGSKTMWTIWFNKSLKLHELGHLHHVQTRWNTLFPASAQLHREGVWQLSWSHSTSFLWGCLTLREDFVILSSLMDLVIIRKHVSRQQMLLVKCKLKRVWVSYFCDWNSL